MTELQGRHILVTRPYPQGSELCGMIEAKGGQATYFPTIAFAPPDQAALEQAIAQLGGQDWLIFISPQAVYASIPLIRRQWPQFPPATRFAAVGAGTSHALREAGYIAVHPQDEWNSEGLLSLPAFQTVSGQKIAIIRGAGGRQWLDDSLVKRGAQVLPVIVYQRILPPADIREYLHQLEQGRIDAIVCTSFEGVRNLKILLAENGWPFIQELPLFVVSERIKRLAWDLGFQTIWVTERANNEAILQRLIQFVNEKAAKQE